MEIPLVYTRGAEKDKPLPPGTYTLTVYLTAAVQGHPSGTIDGVKAYTTAQIRIIVRPAEIPRAKTCCEEYDRKDLLERKVLVGTEIDWKTCPILYR